MKIQNIILWRRFFSGLAYTAMQSVFFIYLQYYKGFEMLQITTAFSLLVFSSQAFSLFAGAWGDRFGRMKLMFFGCLLDSLAYILLLTTYSYPFLLLATFCFGFGSTLFSTNARAYLVASVSDNYSAKTRAQGLYLKISSLASMVAPLLSLPFVYYRKAEWLILTSGLIEIAMLLFMAKTMPKCRCNDVKPEKFSFRQLKEILSKRFVFAHILLFIPLGIGTSFYVIFPFIFTNLLDKQELVSVAFFVNNLVAVLLQSRFSSSINFGISKLLFIAPLVMILLFVPWFYTLQFVSVPFAFVYLILFALVNLFTNTALANFLVKIEKGHNQGLMFGTSKLILSVTTAGVMNVLPALFLI